MTSGDNIIVVISVLLIVLQVVCLPLYLRTKDHLFAALIIFFSTFTFILSVAGVILYISWISGFLFGIQVIIGAIFYERRYQESTDKKYIIGYVAMLECMCVVFVIFVVVNLFSCVNENLADISETSAVGIEAVYETEAWHGALK